MVWLHSLMSFENHKIKELIVFGLYFNNLKVFKVLHHQDSCQVKIS